MGAPADEGEIATRFADQAKAAGLALPASARFDPWLAAGVGTVLVLAAVTVGYATNWVNLSRTHPGPLSELPSCPPGGVSIGVATETGASASLPTAWPALASSFSSATGGCLSVGTSPSSSGLGQLSSLALDGLVGPLLPTTSSDPGLAGSTYDVPLAVAPVVVLVNIQGLVGPISLSAAALAGMYLGNVTSWSNPLLTATHPTLASTGICHWGSLAAPFAKVSLFRLRRAPRGRPGRRERPPPWARGRRRGEVGPAIAVGALVGAEFLSVR